MFLSIRQYRVRKEFDVLECVREIVEGAREILLATSSRSFKNMRCCLFDVLDCAREYVEPERDISLCARENVEPVREISLAASTFTSMPCFVSFFAFGISDSGR